MLLWLLEGMRCVGVKGCDLLAQYGNGESLRCDRCRQKSRTAGRLAKLEGVICGCGLLVSPQCPDGELCEKCNRARITGGAVCSFEGCDETQAKVMLCNGHSQQLYRGDPLTPLGTTYTKRDYDGCALYLFRARLASGAMVDVFGVTEPDVKLRLSAYECVSRGRPGLVITEVHGWWRWEDKQTARTVERELAELAVHNRSLRAGLKTESWPADDGKVRVALAAVAGYSPDYASKGDE